MCYTCGTRVTLISVFLRWTAFFLERLLNLPAHLHAEVTGVALNVWPLEHAGASPRPPKRSPLACRGRPLTSLIRCTLNSCSRLTMTLQLSQVIPGGPFTNTMYQLTDLFAFLSFDPHLHSNRPPLKFKSAVDGVFFYKGAQNKNKSPHILELSCTADPNRSGSEHRKL